MEASEDKTHRSADSSTVNGKNKLEQAITHASDRIEEAYERLARVERQLNLGTTPAPSVDDNALLSEYDAIVSEKLAGVFEAAISIGGRVELLVQFLPPFTPGSSLHSDCLNLALPGLNLARELAHF